MKKHETEERIKLPRVRERERVSEILFYFSFSYFFSVEKMSAE